ncbi:MAG: hypothetical protein ACREMS_13475 [Gemmatimonadaceae bacterium]
MLIATPTGWLSRNILIEENTRLVAEIDGSPWGQRASATVGKATYALYRETLFKANYVMERGGQVVVRANSSSTFGSQFDVAWADHNIVLRRLSLWTQTFGLFKNDEQLGTVRPTGIFKRRGTVEGASSIPLEVRVFLVWVALMTWRRQGHYVT